MERQNGHDRRIPSAICLLYAVFSPHSTPGSERINYHQLRVPSAPLARPVVTRPPSMLYLAVPSVQSVPSVPSCFRDTDTTGRQPLHPASATRWCKSSKPRDQRRDANRSVAPLCTRTFQEFQVMTKSLPYVARVA